LFVPTASLHKEIESLVRRLQRVVSAVQPEAMTGDEALCLVSLLAEAERASASGIALLTPIVVKAGSYTKVGHASASDWLGAVSGSSVGVAKGRLVSAERAAASPDVTEALHDGQLSPAQLKIVAAATGIAPEAPGALLSLIAQGASNQELSGAAARQRGAARQLECERERRARVQANRHFRWHQDENGGIRSEIYCDEAQWARFFPVLEADAKARFKAAGASGGDSLEAHRLDAFIDLMARAGGPGGPGGPGSRSAAHHRAIVIVDAAALRRGTTQGDELCEIDGVGPVSVEAATELIGEAGLQFVITDGIDVRTVTGSSRVIAQRINAALLVRDRSCVVPTCGKRLGLELDHCKVAFKDDGPAELSNLARLCPECHNLKTNGGWKLGGGPGHWTWDPAPHPPNAHRIKRNRKLAAARAKAKRNRPLRN
jgi:hypothetical protein